MLTDLAIKSAKPREAPYKLGDSGGLYLQVTPTGGKLWRWKYRVAGKEKKLSLGAYPDVSLPHARKARDEARGQLQAGQDPALVKRRKKADDMADAGDTFAAVARDYFDMRGRDAKKRWAEATRERAQHMLGLLLPSLGTIPVRQILPRDVLDAVRKIERRGTQETARRSLQLAGAILRHAVATARLDSDGGHEWMPMRDAVEGSTALYARHYGSDRPTASRRAMAVIMKRLARGELLAQSKSYSFTIVDGEGHSTSVGHAESGQSIPTLFWEHWICAAEHGKRTVDWVAGEFSFILGNSAGFAESWGEVRDVHLERGGLASIAGLTDALVGQPQGAPIGGKRLGSRVRAGALPTTVKRKPLPEAALNQWAASLEPDALAADMDEVLWLLCQAAFPNHHVARRRLRKAIAGVTEGGRKQGPKPIRQKPTA